MSAFLIPANLPSKSDVPAMLRGVARVLRDSLSDEVTVWLETGFGDAPCLLILDPTCGVLVLDAVDEHALSEVYSRWSAARVSEVVAFLSDRRTRLIKTLRQPTKSDKLLRGQLAIGVGIAVPLCDRNRLFRRFGRDIAEAKMLLTKEDFLPETLPQAIRRAISTRALPKPVVSEAVARAILHPEIVIGGPEEEEGDRLLFRPSKLDRESALRVLDREQERLARGLEYGYRVIAGVAGSGKTVVLAYRAKFLAESFPQWRILLTCYNICLAKALEQELKLRSATDLPRNVHVRHIDSVAASVLRAAGMFRSRQEVPKTNEDWAAFREQAASEVRKLGNLFRYDAVLVDEGQDFDAAGLKLAWSLLREGRDHFVIAMDAAQNIYRKRTEWKPPGVSGRGRTTVLRVNYRNTKEILGFAWRFLTGGTKRASTLRDDLGSVVPPEASARTGHMPEVIQCQNTRSEIREVVERVCRAHSEGTPWGSMAVILGDARRQGALYREMQRREVPYFWVPWNSKTKRELLRHADKVRAFTIHAAKGLEFSHVFFCCVNDIFDPAAEIDPIGRRRLAYVAMTRAMDRLTVTVSGTGDVGSAIIDAASEW